MYQSCVSMISFNLHGKMFYFLSFLDQLLLSKLKFGLSYNGCVVGKVNCGFLGFFYLIYIGSEYYQLARLMLSLVSVCQFYDE